MSTHAGMLNQQQLQFGMMINKGLIISALSLLLIGLIMIASASIDVADVRNNDPFFYFTRHATFALIGLVAGAIVFMMPISFWQKHAFYLLGASLFLLALVLLPGIGKTVNGSTRWIGLGGINIQPSEPAKLLLVAYLAGYLVRRHDEVRQSWWGFTKPMLVLTIAAFLLLSEPDFGATVVIGAAFMGMIFLSGAKLHQFGVLVVACLLIVVALIWSQPYRMERLIGYTDPWADQFGAGYQLTQSLIAFGRGEILGVGLGNSLQKQFYLPEAHTDFVFAILAEEFGLIGSLIVVALFSWLIYRAFKIARVAEKAGLLFHAYFSYGIAILLGVQASINLGVNMGLLPTKGLTLPLVSYGGSSLIISIAAIAILLRVHHETLHARIGESS
ncbi:MAG: putative lipid II flippase FtsW [Oleiphilaceae bacterium]|nr:putative lipid II flippase FtsW [Oleiphilaceae bacterium]